MTLVLTVGTLVGVVIGLVHAGYVYRRVAVEGPVGLAERPFAARAQAGYYALWTLGLWILFGAYVFVLWLISVAAYAIYRTFR